jgi:hypothetical protein
LGPGFFGLPNNYREIILEEQFALIYRANFDYISVLKMPIMYRQWFIKRYIKVVDEKNAINKASTKK